MTDDPRFPKRDILCIDCKSFFASVECAERGLDPMTAKLCVVSRAHLKGGLVLAASPRMKAEYGVKTGTRVFELPKRDPEIVLVPPRMGLYVQRNQEIVRLFLQFVAPEDCHPYSIDEAFLDITRSHALFGSTYQIARRIQTEVMKHYGIPTCVGIGDNMLLAKLALDNAAKKKPPYLAYWSYKRVPETLWKMDNLSDFWGIGSRTKATLERLGIYTVKQLAHADPRKLKRHFGVLGLELYHHANGLDGSLIHQPYQEVSKSYGASQILERDYWSMEEVALVLREMAEQVAARLRKGHQLAGELSLFIGYAHDEIPRHSGGQMQIEATDTSHKIIEGAIYLLKKHYLPQPVRSIGISAGKLRPKNYQQLSLFEDVEEVKEQEALDKAVDKIRERYGFGSLVHASSLLPGATAIKRAGLIGGHKE